MIDDIRPAALLASLYSSVAAAATWSSPLALVGMPAPVVFMAFAGAAAGLILQPPKISRNAMFLLTLALTFFAAVSAMFVGFIPHMTWARDAAPELAGIFGLFGQTLVPAVGRRLSNEVNDRGAAKGTDGGAP